MKKAIILSFLLMASALVFRADAKPQIAKLIRFAKGKSSATIKGMTGTYGVNYVVRTKSGQKLIINLAPIKQVGIKIETVGRNGHEVLLREEKGGVYEIGLEEGGDLTIFIGSTNHKPVAFTLTLQIAKLADI